MKRAIRNYLILLLLLIIVVFPSKIQAEETITFNTSNYSDENIKINFQNSEIIFLSFPKHENFKYVMISLYGEDGTIYNKKKYATNSEISYSIKNLKDGHYYIQIYTSPTEYGTYWSYMYNKKGIKIEVSNGLVAPLQSLVFENNNAVYKRNVADKKTIQYYLQPSSSIQCDNYEIIECAKSIVLDTDSDYEKVRKVHDWVTEHIWYDFDAFYSNQYGETDAVGVLHSKKSVCQGYADLTAALLRSIGIPTKVQSGYALGLSTTGEWTNDLVKSDASNHAWNEAYVDNRWIIIDTTWDSNNQYRDGQYSQGTGLSGYRYFDPTIEFFSYDHKMFDTTDKVVDYEKNLDCFTLKTKNLTLYYDKDNQTSKYMVIDIDDSKLEVWDWNIEYKSSNPNVASISNKGKIVAKKIGTTKITATIKIGNISKQVSINVTVRKPYIEVAPSVKTIKVGTNHKIKLKSYGCTSIKYYSSNKKVATVSQTGIITGKRKGTITLTIKSGDVKKKIKVRVI